MSIHVDSKGVDLLVSLLDTAEHDLEVTVKSGFQSKIIEKYEQVRLLRKLIKEVQ